METDKNNNETKLLALSADDGGENKKGRMDFYIEIALIFILGILIGIAVKTEAVKRITMGFNDYKIKIADDRYSISRLEKDLIGKQSKEAENQPAVSENSGSGQ